MSWALDLGTTNSALARWDAQADEPRVVRLPSVCRDPDRVDPLESGAMVPSATHLLADDSLWSRFGLGGLARQLGWIGPRARIGRAAIELDPMFSHPELAPSFKAALANDPLQTLARLRGQPWAARAVAGVWVHTLLGLARAATGDRLDAVLVAAPVESFDTYRAEVRRLLIRAGVRRVGFVDEPVAAAAGYGLAIDRERQVLVVDFGGGTLDLARVQLAPRSAEQGRCEVLAKEGRAIGGDAVDRWLLEAVAERAGFRMPDPEDREERFFFRWLVDEARAVKERLYLQATTEFLVHPPAALQSALARLRLRDEQLTVRRDDLVRVLQDRGVYAALGEALDAVDASGRADDVLLVGGSVLLPGVYSQIDARYGRDRVRAYRPFEAVALGACALASVGFARTDLLVHDYAVVTYDGASGERRYEPIVARGTRYPTAPDHWRKQMVPLCPLGEPETQFSLVICEIGRSRSGEAVLGFDAEGRPRRLEGERDRLVVPLNDKQPALGRLDPPHRPQDRAPRLDVALGVDADRWLVATVRDLRSGRTLMDGEPVVRLL